MNSAHMSAVLLTFTIYTILAVAYFGWGNAIAYLLGLERQENRSISSFIWIGWAFTLFLFQLIHFFLPLTVFVAIPALIVGMAFAIPQIITAYRHYINQFSRRKLLVLLGIIAVLFTISGWIASRSMLPPLHFDSGLYHFNKIRWINTFPIVPGLGNLHGRLAFNQSFFVYVASLNFYPFFNHGHSVATSFLLLLTIATFIDSLRPVFKRPYLLVESHPFQYLSIIIAFPALGYLALTPVSFLSSPSPDTASTLLQLTMIIGLAQGLGEWKNGQTNQKCRVLFLGILATTAVTVKLSNLAFSAVIMGFLLLLYARNPHTIQAVIRIVTLSAIMILVWCLQSFVMSGAPLYPSTIGYVPVEWAVPKEKVIEEANWVYSFARQPWTHWNSVIGNWHWFQPWLLRMSKNIINVIFPLIVSVLFCIITATIYRFKKGSKTQYLEWSILLPSIIGLIYWFFTAPDPRFAHALFFITSICSAILFLTSIQTLRNRRIFITCICIVFVISNLNFIWYFIEMKDNKAISLSGWHPITSVPLEERITSSGLLVYTPKNGGQQCWDSPLPSTPYYNFNIHLRLKNSENLSAGFTVTRKE